MKNTKNVTPAPSKSLSVECLKLSVKKTRPEREDSWSLGVETVLAIEEKVE